MNTVNTYIHTDSKHYAHNESNRKKETIVANQLIGWYVAMEDDEKGEKIG